LALDNRFTMYINLHLTVIVILEMKLTIAFRWFHDKIRSYNLFMTEENDYDDDDEIKNTEIVIQQQRYTTRLYILMLMCKVNVFRSTKN